MTFESTLRALNSFTTFIALSLCLLLLILMLESWRPAQPGKAPGGRWPAALGLQVINDFLGYELGRWLMVAVVALHMPVNSFLARHYEAAPLAVLAASVLALDFSQYLFHRLLHRFDTLWRVHRVHHSDRRFDIATSLRFHPFEAGLNVIWRLAWVLALGVPSLALIAYGLISLFSNAFAHANLRLPAGLDRVLRGLLITPSLHRIHHSLDDSDSRHNYGTVFSLWDRVLGTYRQRSQEGSALPETGVAGIPLEQTLGLWRSLRLPFARVIAPPPPRPGRRRSRRRS